MTEINKIITELEDYEKNIRFPLAGQQIELDLDDGEGESRQNKKGSWLESYDFISTRTKGYNSMVS
mgnify:CR=1 FL=1